MGLFKSLSSLFASSDDAAATSLNNTDATNKDEINIPAVEKTVHTTNKNTDGLITEYVFDEEPNTVAGKEKIQTMDVALPLFTMAFKDKPVSDPKKLITREVAGGVAKNVLFGQTSQFHEDMYNLGLINSEFYADYDICPLYAMASLGGESHDPLALRDHIQDYLGKMLKQGLPEDSCKRILSSATGSMLKRFNSPVSLGKMFATSYLAGINPFDYFEAYGKISYNDVVEVFREIYSGEMVTSIVKGIE